MYLTVPQPGYGGHTAGRGHPVRAAAARGSPGPPPPEEPGRGAHPLHDGVVPLHLLPHPPLALRPQVAGYPYIYIDIYRIFILSTYHRIWDMFLCEGVKVLFRVALVLLKAALPRKVNQ